MTTRNRSGEPRVSARQRQMARWQRERRRQRLALAIGAAILMVIVAIPAFGYYVTFIAPPRQVVASINGTKHTMGDLVDLTLANVAFQVQGGRQPQLSSLPFEILDGLIEGELIKQEAPNLGIFVTQDEIDQRLRDNFYPTVPEGQQPSTDQLEREYRQNVINYLNVTQYSEGQYHEIIRLSILREKARELMSDSVPAVDEQVYVEWIVLSLDSQTVQEDVNTITSRLEAGTDFDVLARQFSTDQQYADSNGVVGWVPRLAFPKLDDVIFSIEHDTLSDPLFGAEGFYLLRVTDGPETREVSEKMQEAMKTSFFNQWLLDLRRVNDVEVKFGSTEYEWLVRKVRDSIPASSDQGTV